MMKPEIFNTTKTKKLNRELVVSALVEKSPCTRKKIAELTGLSVATCGNILNELIARGEAFEKEAAESNGGRPARCYVYNPNHSFVAGLFLAKENDQVKITYSIANMTAEIIEKGSKQVDSVNYRTIDAMVSQLFNKNKNIQAISIGIPGVVNHGSIVDDCDFAELINYPLEAKLSAKYQIKVMIENDMNLKALGFYRKQEYDSPKSIAVINFPSDSCSGSGIIVDGHILKGNSNFAGEVSYLPLKPTRDMLVKKMVNEEKSLDPIIQTVISVISIINPDTIALTGDRIQPSMLHPILDDCLKWIPEKHMPHIIIREDIQDEYLTGLLDVSLKSLGCEIQLIKKHL